MTLAAKVRKQSRRRKIQMPVAPACALLKNQQDEYLTSGVKEAYAYDGMGRRTAETRDPEGLNLTTSFTYDSEGRLTRTTRPDGKHSDSTYDYAGNRLTFADEKERMTEYFYDNENRLIRVEAPAQAPVDYVYDSAGNLLAIKVNDDGDGDLLPAAIRNRCFCCMKTSFMTEKECCISGE
jgi:YD repeat-containing protein